MFLFTYVLFIVLYGPAIFAFQWQVDGYSHNNKHHRTGLFGISGGSDIKAINYKNNSDLISQRKKSVLRLSAVSKDPPKSEINSQPLRIPLDFLSVEEKWALYYKSKCDEYSPHIHSSADRKANDQDIPKGKNKFYVLSMIPYPSGSGLHVGHCYTYTIADIIARFQRLKLRRGMILNDLKDGSKGPVKPKEDNGYPPQPNVLHVMGWDSFGLPAEQHAREKGLNPALVVDKCIQTFRHQLQRLGLCVDWRREFATSDEQFYKWTQWIFIRMLKYGLAEEKKSEVNWCPTLCTVLSSEEVTSNGLSERGRFPVYRVSLPQWHLKITKYANRLLDGLEMLNWPADVLQMQKNWIGKKDFLTCDVSVLSFHGDQLNQPKLIPISAIITDKYIFGDDNYCIVMHPKHKYASAVAFPKNEANNESILMRSSKKKSKKASGGRLGLSGSNVYYEARRNGPFALHPLGKGTVPIFFSDVIETHHSFNAHLNHNDALLVPINILITHLDQSLRRKGQQHDSNHKMVKIAGDIWKNLTEPDMPFSLPFTKDEMNYMLENFGFKDWIELVVTGRIQRISRYRLRDWVFSRQRFWGEPIPLLRTEDKRIIPLEDEELPLNLPPFDEKLSSLHPVSHESHSVFSDVEEGNEKWKPSSLAILSRYKSWIDPSKGKRQTRKESSGQNEESRMFREPCTMPQWAGSSWSHVRFTDPQNDLKLADENASKFWLPVDVYVGGKEHAVTHLIYARFWHKFLRDIGFVDCDEPFKRLITPGVILGNPKWYIYQREDTKEFICASKVQRKCTHAKFEGRDYSVKGGLSQKFDINPRNENFAQKVSETASKTEEMGLYNVGKRIDIESGQSVQMLEVTEAQLEKSTDEKYKFFRYQNRLIRPVQIYEKMSKSKGNAVSPDQVINEYGADALRIHLMSLGPVEARKKWHIQGLIGAVRFLTRVWKLFPLGSYAFPDRKLGANLRNSDPKAGKNSYLSELVNCTNSICGSTVHTSDKIAVDKLIKENSEITENIGKVRNHVPTLEEFEVTNEAIKQVTNAIEEQRPNIAISYLMKMTRDFGMLQKSIGGISVHSLKTLLTLLHPFAPFVTEHLWNFLNKKFPQNFKYAGHTLIASAAWPNTGDCLKFMKTENNGKENSERHLSVQINGKHRISLLISATDLKNEEKVRIMAFNSEDVKRRILIENKKNKELAKILYIPSAAALNLIFEEKTSLKL